MKVIASFIVPYLCPPEDSFCQPVIWEAVGCTWMTSDIEPETNGTATENVFPIQTYVPVVEVPLGS